MATPATTTPVQAGLLARVFGNVYPRREVTAGGADPPYSVSRARARSINNSIRCPIEHGALQEIGPEGPLGAHVSFQDDQENIAANIAPPATSAQSVRPYWHGDVSIRGGGVRRRQGSGGLGSMRWSISSSASSVS